MKLKITLPYGIKFLVMSENREKILRQELSAWQPISTPLFTFFSLLFVSIISFISSAGLSGSFDTEQKAKFFEQSIMYDDGKTQTANATFRYEECRITEINQGYSSIVSGDNQPCFLQFEVQENIPLSQELFLYYELTNVYQNHRRYMESRSISQLDGSLNTLNEGLSAVVQDLEDSCDVEESLVSFEENEERIYFPCGLIPQSYFNDGVQLSSFVAKTHSLSWVNGISVSDEEDVEVTLSQEFEELAETEYKNPTRAVNFPQYDLYEYIWQTYDQFSCYPEDNPAERSECNTWKQVALSQQNDLDENTFIKGSGCASCVKQSHVLINEGGILPPDDFSDSNSENGVRFAPFVLWMKNAAFSSFRKPFAKLKFRYLEEAFTNNSDIEVEDLTYGFEKGDLITLRVIPNFPVSEFDGTKTLVLSSEAPLDTNRDLLSQGFFWLGVASISFCFLVGLKLRVRPRVLGDPTLV
eukprot:augustus_masked-scaffold_5-processed-gene-15.54-mRNA-1 protein AED:1.00 eAED:1.00 QI:0/-1/0/0/-1/1/1/0/469